MSGRISPWPARWERILESFPFWHVVAAAAVLVALSGCGSFGPAEPQPDDPIVEPGPADPAPFEPEPDDPQPERPRPRPRPQPNPFDDGQPNGQPEGAARTAPRLGPQPPQVEAAAAVAKQTAALLAQNELMVKRLADTEAKLAAAKERDEASHWTGCEIRVREDESCEYCLALIQDLKKEAARRTGWVVGHKRARGVHFCIVDVGEHEDVPKAIFYVNGRRRDDLEIDGYAAKPGEINQYFDTHPSRVRCRATSRSVHERIGEDLFAPDTLMGQAERQGWPETLSWNGYTYRKRGDGFLGYRVVSAEPTEWVPYVAYPVTTVTSISTPAQSWPQCSYGYSAAGCAGGMCAGGMYAGGGCSGGMCFGR